MLKIQVTEALFEAADVSVSSLSLTCSREERYVNEWIKIRTFQSFSLLCDTWTELQALIPLALDETDEAENGLGPYFCLDGVEQTKSHGAEQRW